MVNDVGETSHERTDHPVILVIFSWMNGMSYVAENEPITLQLRDLACVCCFQIT